MQTILAFAFVLGVLVFVHELGHFMAAKRVGIKVLKFQLGFNPTVFSFRRGDTEYSIGALPLGGYVKMAGESPEEERTGSSDEFLSKTKWQRFQVLIMGPVMNLLLAFVLTSVILYYDGIDKYAFQDQPVVIYSVLNDSPAAQAGIQAGDRVVAVADKTINTWADFGLAIGMRAHRETAVRLIRNGAEQTVMVTPGTAKDSRFEIGDIGVNPDAHPHIRSVVPGEAAEKAGLQVNDVVLAVNGEPISFQTQLREVIASHPEQPLAISVLRNGEPLTITATPARRGDSGLLGIGIADETVSIKPGVFEAITLSAKQNVQMAGLILETLWGLFTRETSPKQLMGPVAIAQLSGESAQIGLMALLTLMASISLNLGLLNLMPIPILDGGHILIMALEGIARRDFSMRVKEKMLLAGFVLLMTLMVTVIYNDLTRITWIERLMPWR
jgi:regulator of sigma E protease